MPVDALHRRNNAMALANVTVDLNGRKLPFVFPDSGNMREQLQQVFSGKAYPVPTLPSGHRIETIVDIGSNVGAAAIWFLGFAPQARIVCFEPAQQNYECLRHNLASFSAAEAIPCGLYSSERTVALYHGVHQCMEHSMFASSETSTQSETIAIKRASTEFDRLGLERISILKIDTEGCEMPILKDLGEKRLSQVDLLYLEWHSEEDRRAIDRMLEGTFLMVGASAICPHRGNATYMALSLAAKDPRIDALRIIPQDDAA